MTRSNNLPVDVRIILPAGALERPAAGPVAPASGSCCGPRDALGSHAVNRSPRPVAGCCGKDLGPMQDFEDPSPEDVERFSDVTRTCPQCKNEVYDDAELCYHCGHAFGASNSGKGVPVWALVAGVVVIGAMLTALVL